MPGVQTTLEDVGVYLGPRVIDRPEIGYDDDAHAYTLDGRPVPGVSTVAKIGSDTFTPGAWWGWKIATEGVVTLLEGWDEPAFTDGDVDRLRAILRDEGYDPNQKRDRAADRGTSVHDALEKLAQDGIVPNPEDYPEAERGHVLSLLRWYLHYRPEFEATEVIVGSRTHGFAGRYDLRVRIPGLGLGLVDLKTSAKVYPEQHFPQLGGYELGSVEIGFAPTDFQAVLRTSEDGSFVPHDGDERWDRTNFVLAWGDPCELFLAYLTAYNAREAMYFLDPKRVARREAAAARLRLEGSILDLLDAVGEIGATGKELAEQTGAEPKAIRTRLQALRKAGRVTCQGRTWRAT